MKQELQTTHEERLPLPFLPEQADNANSEALTVEAEDSLVASVRKRMTRYHRNMFASILYCGVGTLGFALAAQLLLRSSLGEVAIRYVFSLAVVIYGTIFAALFYPRQLLTAGKRDIESVAAQQDIKTVGTLIDLSGIEKEMHGVHAQEGLITLLPRLRPEHANLLNNRQRAALRRVLGINIELTLYRDVNRLFTPVSLAHPANRRAIEFRVAIMEAFANIGTKEDLPFIERLAAMEAASEVQSVLKSAAEKCLPLLQTRVAELEDKNSLLRASSAYTDGANTLLRPATATHSDPAEELLRPVK